MFLFAMAVCVPTALRAQWINEDEVPLPKFETLDELQRRGTVVPPPAFAPFPPPGPVRMMAEFEQLEGIIIRWAYNTQNLLLSQIVDAAQEEGRVWIITRPGTSDSTNIKSYLQSRNIPVTNLEFHSINSNSIWCRDYGPWTVYDVATDSLAIVDFKYNRPARPQDDVVPVALASLWGVPIYQTLAADSLTHTGGNFMVDGFGTGFASRLIMLENTHLTEAQVDTILAHYGGLHRFVKMQTLLYDGIHHIDMHMKLLDEETLLIGQYPVNVSDYVTIENTVNYLRTLENCYGRPYRIVRIPMPPSSTGQYPPNSSYYTYTNSIIINKTVLVPIYGFPLDATALQIYRDAMPGYTVIGYDCNAIIGQSGAIHCIVKEVGVREPVLFAHAWLSDTQDTSSDYRVEARISSARTSIDSAFIYWTTDTTAGFAAIPMTDSVGIFVGHIPAQTHGTSIWYYLSAATGSGRTVTKPLVGASGAHRFDVEDSVATTVASGDVPVEFRLHQNYPNPFNPVTVVGYTIPSPARVILKVYNLVGQEVETLFEGDQEAGLYHAQWDGSRYATGLYFFRMAVSTTGGERFLETRKALLLK